MLAGTVIRRIDDNDVTVTDEYDDDEEYYYYYEEEEAQEQDEDQDSDDDNYVDASQLSISVRFYIKGVKLSFDLFYMYMY